ncbi:hypothetical protein VDG1235_346 [Verrucomicrobiia bacterium DG1235]|nr:hypothetical protein VDG1235_346 [Verrucomicrobiae bacterium DG1235]
MGRFNTLVEEIHQLQAVETMYLLYAYNSHFNTRPNPLSPFLLIAQSNTDPSSESCILSVAYVSIESSY